MTRPTPPPTERTALVKNAGSEHFSVVDLDAREEVGRVGDGTYPHTAAFHPDGRHAYLLYITSAHLEVVDLERLETVGRVDDLGTASVGSALTDDGRRLFVGTAGALPDDDEPGVMAFRVPEGRPVPERIGTRALGKCAGMCLGPDGRLYVAVKSRGELVALSPTAELAEGTRYAVGERPHDVYPVPGTDLVAVNNAGESFTTFVDVGTKRVAAQVPTGENPHGIAFADGPDGRRAYVPARDDDRLTAVDLDAVEAGENDAAAFVDVGTTTGFAATTPDGRYVLVDSYDESHVTVVDAASRSVVGRVDVGGQPMHLVVSPDGDACFVGNMDRPCVTVLDLSPLRSDRPADVTVADRIEGLGDLPSGIFTPPT
ncbi:YncE family protein [Salinilacihabitans rarus]|uniref:YncE family protein n=1 Tax=Salinilacihabitans rarus TaxID=2961596 RepID=UPI0020C8A1D2|nr:YncE family protein [Salinilacihabitans rarus]